MASQILGRTLHFFSALHTNYTRSTPSRALLPKDRLAARRLAARRLAAREQRERAALAAAREHPFAHLVLLSFSALLQVGARLAREGAAVAAKLPGGGERVARGLRDRPQADGALAAAADREQRLDLVGQRRDAGVGVRRERVEPQLLEAPARSTAERKIVSVTPPPPASGAAALAGAAAASAASSGASSPTSARARARPSAALSVGAAAPRLLLTPGSRLAAPAGAPPAPLSRPAFGSAWKRTGGGALRLGRPPPPPPSITNGSSPFERGRPAKRGATREQKRWAGSAVGMSSGCPGLAGGRSILIARAPVAELGPRQRMARTAR